MKLPVESYEETSFDLLDKDGFIPEINVYHT